MWLSRTSSNSGLISAARQLRRFYINISGDCAARRVRRVSIPSIQERRLCECVGFQYLLIKSGDCAARRVCRVSILSLQRQVCQVCDFQDGYYVHRIPIQHFLSIHCHVGQVSASTTVSWIRETLPMVVNSSTTVRHRRLSNLPASAPARTRQYTAHHPLGPRQVLRHNVCVLLH